jgi:hypothetical protein
MKAPLHVHVLFHPSSEEARSLATQLAEDWMGLPGVQGLRVPVFFGREDGTNRPGEVDVDTAEHTLIAVLVDDWMTDRVGGQGAEWAEQARELSAAHPPGGRHLVMPAALSDSAYEWDPELGRRHFLPLDRAEDPDRRRARLSFGLAVRALHLLGDAASPEALSKAEAPVTLFVSHAKRDLDQDRQDPVRSTQEALQDLPVREWLDAREIREGATFEEEIRDGIGRASAMLVFLTDAWATRPWCRTEALIAKEMGTPIVVVDALTLGEPRSFPYTGNTRWLRWRIPSRPPEDAAALRGWQQSSRTEGERMIAAAVGEALRQVHARHRLRSLAREEDVVLDVAPEAARLGWQDRAESFLYPDPPLGREEQGLLSRIWPESRFETPMMRMARRRAGQLPGLPLAVSISESPDLAKLGLTPAHQRLVVDEVHLYLMLAGLQIVYGGKLEPEKMDDPDNFTLRLFALARSYSGLAADAGANIASVRNVAPWPLWKLYGPEVTRIFGRIAELDRVPCPELGLSDAELGALENGFVPPVSPPQLYAWARALTHMRERVTESTAARLCIGGRILGYKGRYAGLVEEPLLSLRARKPLYLVGALGGCTDLVIDLLEQRPRPEMTEDFAAANVPGYAELRELYAGHGGQPPDFGALAEELRKLGADGPGEALANGLDNAENRELFTATDPHTIATLVLTGLERLDSV